MALRCDEPLYGPLPAPRRRPLASGGASGLGDSFGAGRRRQERTPLVGAHFALFVAMPLGVGVQARPRPPVASYHWRPRPHRGLRHWGIHLRGWAMLDLYREAT